MVAIDVSAASRAESAARTPRPAPAPGALQLARRLHETVVQRLAGLSLTLGAEQPFEPVDRARCRDEVLAALDELRVCLEGAVVGHEAASVDVDVAAELRALAAEHPDAEVSWTPEPGPLAGPAEQLVNAVLAEGLRNARKHANPRRVRLEVARDAETVVVALHNDGVVTTPRRGCGMGLQLLATEASFHGGLIDGRRAEEEGWWSLSLILPIGA